MSRAGRRAVAAVSCVCVLAAPSVVAQGTRSARADASRDALTGLLDRATAYVERFYREFGSVVAEERYEQRIRPAPGSRISLGGRTVLLSDFLLVEVPGGGWVPFRDVLERDGKPVGDRQARLADLFLSGAADAFEQGRAVLNESARYNIGNVDRNINVPTIALAFLLREQRDRFAFERDGRDGDAVVVAYEEEARPTIVRTGQGGDFPVAGRFWLDEVEGTVLRTELRAVNTRMDARVTVTFAYDAGVQSRVPVRMEERYRRRNDGVQVQGEATYSRFRRFQVRTDEQFSQ